MNDRSESAPETGGRTPTHDQICTFDPNLCRDCRLQAEARADEREQAAQRVAKAIKHNRSCIIEDAPDCFCERGIAVAAARGEDAK